MVAKKSSGRSRIAWAADCRWTALPARLDCAAERRSETLRFSASTLAALVRGDFFCPQLKWEMRTVGEFIGKVGKVRGVARAKVRR